MRIKPILAVLALIFFAVINVDLAFSQAAIVNENEISVEWPIADDAKEVKLRVNGLVHILKWVKPDTPLYNEAIEKIKDHPNFKSGGPILFQYNPTCFWFMGRLY